MTELNTNRDYSSTLQPLADRAAIGLSLLCVVHCLALPVLLVMLPSLAGLGLDDDRFHTWLVVVVIPLSAFALTLGCARHRNMNILYTGVAGLVVLCLAPLLGHDMLGEMGERALTLAGAGLIALSHVRNFRLCRNGAACDCH
ncbi:MAG: MerC domain-containing protein [Halioglobus sp.]